MRPMLFYPVAATDAVHYAVRYLHRMNLSTIDHPAPEITHLLLDVPSFLPDGRLRTKADIQPVLDRIPTDVTIIGGNLNHPALSGYQVIDLLQDEEYLARNAAITADCAMRVAAPLLKITFRDTPTLILGCGRIGKCLGQLLKSIGTPVTIAARKPKDRAMLKALGFEVVDFSHLPNSTRLVFNTVPDQVPANLPNCVKIDLASIKGLPGEDVIWAKGLPGAMAPESSGTLIAQTILRLCKEVDL